MSTHDDHLRNAGLDTKAIHAGGEIDPTFGAVAPPIYQTSTFAFRSTQEGADRFAGKAEGYIYTRMGNPTIDRLERAAAVLEGGAGAMACATGMAAVSTLYFGLLSAGDHMVGTHAVYGPSRVVMERDFSRFGVESTWLDTSDLDAVRAAIRPETKLLYIETPANPTMLITDIASCATIAREHGLILAVDNTFASPILQRPIEQGADIIIHSTTKFLNGHTDVVGGLIVCRTAEQKAKLRPALNYLGGTMDPHQAWLVLRGLRTLPLRVRATSANGLAVARFLETHPAVEWVKNPGLESHPQHELAMSQMSGPGALIAFGLKGGFDAGRTFLDNVRLMTLAVSLGGLETLIQHPASMTHAGMSPEARLSSGITDGLVRVSVGAENLEDILADFKQGLDRLIG